MVRPIRRSIAVLVAVGLALSGCGIIGKPSAGPGGSSSAAPSPSPSPPAPSLPVAGECHINNSVEQIALSDDLADCDACLLYTSPSPRDRQKSRMPSSA